jgi:hypothetical protein
LPDESLPSGLGFGVWDFFGAWDLRFPFAMANGPSASRMKLPVDRLESLLIHVRVNLRRRNVSVPEHFLDDPQIGAVA